MCVLSPQCSWLWPVRSDMVERIWTSSGWRFVKTCSWRTSRRFLRCPRRRRAWPVSRSGWLRNWENTPTRSPSRYWAWHTWSESRVCLINHSLINHRLSAGWRGSRCPEHVLSGTISCCLVSDLRLKVRDELTDSDWWSSLGSDKWFYWFYWLYLNFNVSWRNFICDVLLFQFILF